MANVLQFKKKEDNTTKELLESLDVCSIETTSGPEHLKAFGGISVFAVNLDTEELWYLSKKCDYTKHIPLDRDNMTTRPYDLALNEVEWDAIVYLGEVPSVQEFIDALNRCRGPEHENV
jgi:hypothetical protein